MPGGGTGDHDGGGTMNMPECDPCTMPNPPSSCDDDEDEPEPCENSIELAEGLFLDSPLVLNTINDLWNSSNASAQNPFQRREMGGIFIEYIDGGFDFLPFPSDWSSACEIDSGETFFEIPSNAIIRSWIHTHPFSIGEMLYACAQVEFDAEAFYNLNPQVLDSFSSKYTGGPSPQDMDLHDDLVSIAGHDIQGIILDKNGIALISIETDPQNSDTWTRIDPCGYNPEQ